MAPSVPRRAIVRAVAISLPMALAGLLLLKFGGEVSAAGALILVAMPAVTGIVIARLLHAVDALLYTTILSALTSIPVAVIVFGPEGIGTLVQILLPMFVAAVIGVMIGMISRRQPRRLRK